MSDLHTRIVDILDDFGLRGNLTREAAATEILELIEEERT